MKQFCFFNEDDLENLPKDFKLIPFDVAFLDNRINEKPKTLTSEKSKRVHKPLTAAAPGLSNRVESG